MRFFLRPISELLQNVIVECNTLLEQQQNRKCVGSCVKRSEVETVRPHSKAPPQNFPKSPIKWYNIVMKAEILKRFK